jgi:NAD(P) transhydrogenase subunit beta
MRRRGRICRSNVLLAAIALGLGTAVSWWQGKRVPITAMPQMVALYNGMGGGARLLSPRSSCCATNASTSAVPLIVTVVGALIGAISLSGSLIAWAKLDGKIDKTWRMRGQQVLNGAFFVATLASASTSCSSRTATPIRGRSPRSSSAR